LIRITGRGGHEALPDIVSGLRMKIIYDPEVLVWHHRRELFWPHLKQIGNYALHRGKFAKEFPETSLRLSYFVPTIFLVFLIAGTLLSLLEIGHPYAFNFFVAVMAYIFY